MCHHHGFHEKGMGNGDCHCLHHNHGKGFGHGHHFGGPGWAYLTHEERVEHLLHAKENLETQLAEIQKTLDLVKPQSEAKVVD